MVLESSTIRARFIGQGRGAVRGGWAGPRRRRRGPGGASVLEGVLLEQLGHLSGHATELVGGDAGVGRTLLRAGGGTGHHAFVTYSARTLTGYMEEYFLKRKFFLVDREPTSKSKSHS